MIDYEGLQDDLMSMWFRGIQSATTVILSDVAQANKFTRFADECARFWYDLYVRGR